MSFYYEVVIILQHDYDLPRKWLQCRMNVRRGWCAMTTNGPLSIVTDMWLKRCCQAPGLWCGFIAITVTLLGCHRNSCHYLAIYSHPQAKFHRKGGKLGFFNTLETWKLLFKLGRHLIFFKWILSPWCSLVRLF